MIARSALVLGIAVAATGCVTPAVDGHHVAVGEPCEGRSGEDIPCGPGAECVWRSMAPPACMRSCIPQYFPQPCGDGTWCSHHGYADVCLLGGSAPVGAACDVGQQPCVAEARCVRDAHAGSSDEGTCRALCNPFHTELCVDTERCLDGVCLIPCTGPGDCGDGFICSRGRCGSAAFAADCTGDGAPDCPIGQQCGCLDGSTCERIVCSEPDPSLP